MEGNQIGLVTNYNTKGISKVFKKRQCSSALGNKKAPFRKKQNKL